LLLGLFDALGVGAFFLRDEGKLTVANLCIKMYNYKRIDTAVMNRIIDIMVIYLSRGGLELCIK
jgi:hypothetical protein